jgi:hypothetical protein
VVVLVVGTFGLSQPAAAQATTPRGWVDVNFGIAVPAQGDFRVSGTEIIFDELATSRADFRLPQGASFDFGGGAMVTPRLGLGVSFTGTAHRDVAELRIEIPHPFFFNAHAADVRDTAEPLVRAESGTHLQVMLVAHDRDRVRVRLYGGPSFVRVRQESVDTIIFTQVFGIFTTFNSVTIEAFEPRTVEASGWGIHAGADVAYFLTRVVGLGGFVRVVRATVELPNTLGSGRVPVTAGGVQTGGGLRLSW